jgi:hypothetical protein
LKTYRGGFVMNRPSHPLALALGLLLLAACTAIPGRAEAPARKLHILIDASHDGGTWWFPQRTTYSAGAAHQGKELADHLRSLGHQVRELGHGEAINPQRFAGVDVVVRVAGSGAYANWEIDAYDRWVSGGGGLLLLVEHHPQDALAEHFGLQFRGVARVSGEAPHDTTTELARFIPHPLTEGVHPLPYVGGSGLTSQPAEARILGRLSREVYLDLDDNSVKDPGEPAAPAALGVLPFGHGRIVFCGDANLWEAVPKRLIQNTLSYLTAP